MQVYEFKAMWSKRCITFLEVFLMIFVGIDVAKETHYAAVMNSDNIVLVEPFAFSNDAVGFSKLTDKLSCFDKSNILISLESTGIYLENIIGFLYSNGYPLAVINPIQTAAIRKTSVRKTKTDKVDTFLIIKSLMLNSYRLYSEQDIQSLELKSFSRFRKNIKKSIARLKTQLNGYVNIAFPEFAKFFKSGIHIDTSYAILKSYPSPEDIAALHLTKLSNLLSSSSHGRFGKEEAVALKSLAKSSVGVKNRLSSIQIPHTIAQIELLEQQVSEIDKQIKSLMQELNSVIMTIPGISYIDGTMILGEIGNINRFSKPCKLLASAGLDPPVHQSGNFNASHTRMSKRGSKILRFALINAAWQLTLHDNTFNDYYNLKRSQGLNHYGALWHVTHKLVRVLFKLLKFNIPFVSQTLFFSIFPIDFS